jgi:hypothetical protein
MVNISDMEVSFTSAVNKRIIVNSSLKIWLLIFLVTYYIHGRSVALKSTVTDLQSVVSGAGKNN